MTTVVADHNFNHHILRGLQRELRNVTFVTARMLGLAAAGDEAIVEYSVREECVIVTHDVTTFPPLIRRRLESGLAVPHIVLVPAWLAPGAAIEQIAVLLGAGADEERAAGVASLPRR